MTRPLQRGSSVTRFSENGRSHGEDLASKETEDCHVHGNTSLLILLSGVFKRAITPSKFQHKGSESSIKNTSRIQDTGMIADFCALKSLLGSSHVEKGYFPQFPEVASLCTQAGSPVQSRRALSASLGKIILLSFISIFVLVAVLGSTSSNYSASSAPKLLYSSYRRLREEISLDLTSGGIFGLGTLHPKELMVCPKHKEHFVPCYNASLAADVGLSNGEEYERHCDLSGNRHQCLIRVPRNYRIPLRWPASKNALWNGNLKLTRDYMPAKGTQLEERLMLEEDDLLTIRSQAADAEGSHFRTIASIIGVSSIREIGIRTVLDIGCNFGAHVTHLLSLESLTLCVAPYEDVNSRVQLALERGFPAMIGSLITRRLPYSSSSFNMLHCADCGIDWSQKDGLLLMEVDRLLGPNGLFVWVPSMKVEQHAIERISEIAKLMCWESFPQQDHTFIWKKPVGRACHTSREANISVAACDEEDTTIPVYQTLRRCLVTPDGVVMPAGTVPKLQLQPSLPFGLSAEELSDDSTVWSTTLKSYWSIITPLIFSDHPKRPGEDDPLPPSNIFRNVMDMNAFYGGFNSALLQAGKSVWVMNVVPTSGPNTLPVIYHRGFLGVLHNWCEAFPTYPRTYDMLHGIGLLSQLKQVNGCSLSDLLLEMDRLLRPEGWVLLRDTSEVIEEARVAASQMRWDARVIEVEGGDDLRLLVCQKAFWKS